MSERYRVVKKPHVELSSSKLGETPPNKPIPEFCFQVEDSLDDGNYVGGPYATEDEAQKACAKLNAE